MSISYSDGRAVEAEVLRLLQQEDRPHSLKAIAPDQYSRWPIRYHLCPERANLLRHLDFTGLDVLELGAGMGAVSRYLAESARTLTVIEGTEARFAALSARLRDLTNWSGHVANIQDVELTERFDVVCVIGVLEYAELYISGDESPFAGFLKKACQFLNDDGVLVLAIENKLGLKYWQGCAEDHTGLLFDGICGYPLRPSPKTFSRRELRALLNGAGLTQVQEYFPFPDYKMASSVLTEEFMRAQPERAAELATHLPYLSYGLPEVSYFPSRLAAATVAKGGLLADMANSFLVAASASEDSSVLQRLLRAQREHHEVAWHYSPARTVPAKTVFFRPEGGTAEICVAKTPLLADRGGAGWDGTLPLTWQPCALAPLASGQSLEFRLTSHMYFRDWDAFQAEWNAFLTWSLAHWASDSGEEDTLDGGALDAILGNVLLAPRADRNQDSPGTEYVLFDLEWAWTEGLPRSWFVFRNAFALLRVRALFADDCPFGSLQDLYSQSCRAFGIQADFSADLMREVAMQGAALQLAALQPASDSQEHARGALADSLYRALTAPFGHPAFPRDPAAEPGLRERAGAQEQSLRELEAYTIGLQNTLNTRPHRLAHAIHCKIDRLRRLFLRRPQSVSRGVADSGG